MSSELWQRIRAARKAADKTQAEMAKALGLTRPGYAFLESPHADSRVNASVKQLQVIADTTNVPVDLLVSNDTDTADIIRSLLPGARAAAPREVHRVEQEPATYRLDSDMRGMFVTAVRFACTMAGVKGQFDVKLGSLEVLVDFVNDARVACFALTMEDTVPAIGRLLMAERILGAPKTKQLLLYSRAVGSARDLQMQAKTLFGVDVRVVGSPDQAAQLLS